jgi:hypothetical protein
MAIQSLYPSIAPSLSLDFARTKVLDPRITFSRASTATFYDGRTVAKAEENLLLQSQTMNSWSSSAMGITADSTAAPDGTTTAALLTPTSATSRHYIFINSSVGLTSSGVTMTGSVYAKAGTYGFCFVQLTNSTNSGGCRVTRAFDLSSGAIGGYSNDQNSPTGITVTATSVGSGWYRIVITFTAGTAGGGGGWNVVVGPMPTNGSAYSSGGDGLPSYAADGTSGAYFWGAQLEQRSTVTAYTPTTTQPITNYIPVLQTAAANVARFDHNPVTGESLGLLIEEQRTNLLLWSEEFENAAWSKTGTTVTANTIVAPDGTLAGDKLLENTDNNNHFIQQNFTATSGVTYTATVFFKAAESPFLMFGFSGSTPFSDLVHVISINLSTLAVTTASGSPENVSVVSVGNGWYRASISKAPVATGTANIQIRLSKDGIWNNRVYTGDGYSGIYIWGAQLEQGGFSTSYIKTEAAQVTRNADAASMTGTNFTSWFSANEGTIFSEYRLNAASGQFQCPYSINDGTNTNRLQAYQNSTLTSVGFDVTTGSSAQAAVTVTVPNITTSFVRHTAAFKVNDIVAAANGTLSSQDTVAVLAPYTQLLLGRNAINSTPMNGHLRKFAFYPRRVVDAALQALTT